MSCPSKQAGSERIGQNIIFFQQQQYLEYHFSQKINLAQNKTIQAYVNQSLEVQLYKIFEMTNIQIEHQLINIFKQSPTYVIYEAQKDPTKSQLIHWDETDPNILIIPNKKQMNRQLQLTGKCVVGFLQTCFFKVAKDGELIAASHELLNKNSGEYEWLEVWAEGQCKKLLEGDSFLAKTYSALKTRENQQTIRWNQTGDSIIIENFFKFKKLMLMGEIRDDCIRKNFRNLYFENMKVANRYVLRHPLIYSDASDFNWFIVFSQKRKERHKSKNQIVNPQNKETQKTQQDAESQQREIVLKKAIGFIDVTRKVLQKKIQSLAKEYPDLRDELQEIAELCSKLIQNSNVFCRRR